MMKLFKYFCFYVFTSLGIAVSLAWLVSIGVSDFEGARGYAATGIFFVVWIAYTIIFVVYALTNKETVVPLLKNTLLCLCLPAWGLVLGPLTYKLVGSEFSQRKAAYLEQARIDDNLEKIKNDWSKSEWHNNKPLCLAVGDNQWENQCPAAVSIKYCWQMDKSEVYEDVQFDCSKNESALTVVPVGNSTLVVPWCRSYTGRCTAEFVPLYASNQSSKK